MMSSKKEIKMRYVLILLGLMFAGVANAIDCQKLPDCEELGYSKEEVKGCAADGYILCPFDDSYKTCVNYDCETLGFTESDKTSWCADLIECKGNPQMTLCQKPCLATTAQELKDLAESGKCKIVTMKNDINLPEDMTLTLAENTTIDGGGYGLTFNISGTKSGLFAFRLTKNSGLENINVHYKQTGGYGVGIIQGKGSLHDVRFDGGTSLYTNYSSLFADSEVTISGRFEVAFQDLGRSVRLSNNSDLNFINAQVHIKQTGTNKDNFAQGNVHFKNSEVTLEDGGAFLLTPTNATFENIKFNFISDEGAIFWSSSAHTAWLELNNNANVSFSLQSTTKGTVKMLEINLSGTSGEPAHLEINAQNITNTNIRANNVTDTLVLNGVAYHPTKVGTTLLENIPTSPDWEHQ